MLDQTGSIAENLANIRKLYETYTIPNVVRDGTTPFPEDQESLKLGVSIEFKYARFFSPFCALNIT